MLAIVLWRRGHISALLNLFTINPAAYCQGTKFLIVIVNAVGVSRGLISTSTREGFAVANEASQVCGDRFIIHKKSVNNPYVHRLSHTISVHGRVTYP